MSELISVHKLFETSDYITRDRHLTVLRKYKFDHPASYKAALEKETDFLGMFADALQNRLSLRLTTHYKVHPDREGLFAYSTLKNIFEDNKGLAYYNEKEHEKYNKIRNRLRRSDTRGELWQEWKQVKIIYDAWERTRRFE